MKIKCPACGYENEEGAKFCSNCNEPLPEPKIPDTTENLYIKIKKEKPDTDFPGPKKLLDKETFCDIIIEWVLTTFDIKRKKGILNEFKKSIEDLGFGKITENKYFEEIIYFHMWVAYINCRIEFQNANKINDYFSHFINKIHRELFKSFFHRYKRKKLINSLKEKLNGYTDAYNLLIKGNPIFNKSSLGRELYKNLYGIEALDIFANYIFTGFVDDELIFSFKTLAKELIRYKI